MKKISKIAVVVFAVSLPASSYAFDLIGGLLNAGVSAISNVGSAVYNKATEDSPEESAAKRQKAEEAAELGRQKTLAEIESKAGLTPLQREHLRLSYEENYRISAAYMAGQEARDNARREANARALSGAGLAGTVGNSLVTGATVAVSPNNPRNMSDSQLIAQGRDIQRASQPNMDIAASAASGSTSGFDAAHRATIATAATPEQRTATVDKFEQQSGIADVRQQQQIAVSRQMDYALKSTDAPVFTFEQHKGAKVYAEFIGSSKLTADIQAALRTAGYNVVEQASKADVQYQFSGDYRLDETQSYAGVIEDAGAIYEGKAVVEPAKKSAVGSIARGLFGVVTGMNVSAPTNQTYKQQVLVVVNRHADGKDVRSSVWVTGQSQEIQASGMVTMAIKDLFVKTGLRT